MAKYKNIFLFIAIIGTSSAAYFDNTPTNGRQKLTHGAVASVGVPSSGTAGEFNIGSSGHKNGEADRAGTIPGGHSSTDKFVPTSTIESSSILEGSKSRPGTVKRPSSKLGSSVGFQSQSNAPAGDSVGSSGSGSSAIGNKEGYTYNKPANGQAFTLGSSSFPASEIGSRPSVSSVSESRPEITSNLGSKPIVANGIGSRPVIMGEISSRPGATNGFSSQVVSSGVESRPGTAKRPSSRPGSLVGFQGQSDAPVAGKVNVKIVGSSGSGSSAAGNKEGYTYNVPANGQAFNLDSSFGLANGIGSRPGVSSVSASRPGGASGIVSRPSISNGAVSRPGVLGGVSSSPGDNNGFSSQVVSSGVGSRPGTAKKPSSRPGSLVGFQSQSDAPVVEEVNVKIVGSSGSGSSAVGNKEGYSFIAPVNGQSLTHETATFGALGSSSVTTNGIGSRPAVSNGFKSKPGVASHVGSRPSFSNGVGSRPGFLGGVNIRPGATNGFSSNVPSGVESRPDTAKRPSSRPGSLDKIQIPSDGPVSGGVSVGSSGSSEGGKKEGYSYNAPAHGQLFMDETTFGTLESSFASKNGIGSRPGVLSETKSRPGISIDVGSKPSISNGVESRPLSFNGVSSRPGATNGLTRPDVSQGVGSRPSVSNEEGSKPRFPSEVSSRPVATNGSHRPDSLSGTVSRPGSASVLGTRPGVTNGFGSRPGSESNSAGIKTNGHKLGTTGTASGASSSSTGLTDSAEPNKFDGISGLGGFTDILPSAGGLGSGINVNGFIESASVILDDEIPNIPVHPIEALAQAIPGGGTPGIDYPILATVPESEFACDSLPGYYADSGTESQCQVFHICQEDGRIDSFLCPNGTLFNQKYFVCDWWFNVECSISSQYYDLNAEIGIVIEKISSGVSELGDFEASSGSLEGENTGLFSLADDPGVVGVSGTSTVDSSEFGVHVSGTTDLGTQGNAIGLDTHGSTSEFHAPTGSASGFIDQAGSAVDFLTPALSASGIVVPSGTAGGFGKPIASSGSLNILAGEGIGRPGSSQGVSSSLGGATGFVAPISIFGLAGETSEMADDTVSSHNFGGGIATFGQVSIHGSTLGSESVGGAAADVPATLYAIPVGENGRPSAVPSNLYIPPRKF